MTINFNGAGGLFPRLRSIFAVLEAEEAAQGGTLKTTMDAMLASFSGSTGDADSYNRTNQSVSQFDSRRDSVTFKQALQALARNELIAQVAADDPTQAGSFESAFAELVRQMRTVPETVKENVVGVVVTNPNTQGPQIFAETKDSRGDANQQALAETIRAYATGASLPLYSNESVSALSNEWPKGSGISLNAPISNQSSLISNGDFSTLNAVEGEWPSSWALDVGVAGTDVSISDYATQNVVISGSPTAGYYTLILTDASGNAQSTQPIAFDGAGGSVQSAIRALSGYETVTVATAGTSPDFTHTITFTQLVGTQPTVTAVDQLTSGTVTIPSPPGGIDTGALRNRALVLTATATLTRVRQLVSLQAGLIYGCGVWSRMSAAGTGTVRMALIDGAGAVINDDAGNANSFDIAMSGLSTTEFRATGGFFRLPSVLPELVKLEIGVTTASGGGDCYIDEISFRRATAAYTNGPNLLAVQGVRDANAGEVWSLVVSNDRAGRIQTWCSRLFGSQLPSATSGSETISDT